MELAVVSSCNSDVENEAQFVISCDFYKNLTLYQTSPGFYVFEEQVFNKKKCGIGRNCSLRAISPFPAVFFWTHLDNFLPFSSDLKKVVCKHFELRKTKNLSFEKGLRNQAFGYTWYTWQKSLRTVVSLGQNGIRRIVFVHLQNSLFMHSRNDQSFPTANSWKTMILSDLTM